MGWVKAIWRPAIKVPIVRCAAIPTTRPIIPADASIVVPSCRTFSKVIKIVPTAKIATTTVTIRLNTSNWVWTFRALMLSFTLISNRLSTASSKTYVILITSQDMDAISNRAIMCIAASIYLSDMPNISKNGTIRRSATNSSIKRTAVRQCLSSEPSGIRELFLLIRLSILKSK